MGMVCSKRRSHETPANGAARKAGRYGQATRAGSTGAGRRRRARNAASGAGGPGGGRDAGDGGTTRGGGAEAAARGTLWGGGDRSVCDAGARGVREYRCALEGSRGNSGGSDVG